MLDLQARVHLEEVELAVVGDEELDGAGVGVADAARRGDRGGGQAVAQRRGHRRRRGFLDDLLVPALDRALALAEVHDGAVLVGEDLDLDVARPLEVALEEDAAVAERRQRLARRPPRSAAANSPAARTMRMPLPPPPAAALMSSG